MVAHQLALLLDRRRRRERRRWSGSSRCRGRSTASTAPRGRSSRRRSRCTRSSAPASCGVRTSPLPMTGMCFTAATTSAMPSSRACAGEAHLGRAAVDGDRAARRPLPAGRPGTGRRCRSRPTPAAAWRSAACAAGRPSIWSTMRSVRSGSHSSLLPPSRLVTLSTGQPMLMSMTCAPRSSAQRAASQSRSTFAAVKLHAQRRVLRAGGRQFHRPLCSRAARPRGRADRCRPARPRRRSARRAGTPRRSTRRSARAAGWSPAGRGRCGAGKWERESKSW